MEDRCGCDPLSALNLAESSFRQPPTFTRRSTHRDCAAQSHNESTATCLKNEASRATTSPAERETVSPCPSRGVRGRLSLSDRPFKLPPWPEHDPQERHRPRVGRGNARAGWETNEVSMARVRTSETAFVRSTVAMLALEDHVTVRLSVRTYVGPTRNAVNAGHLRRWLVLELCPEKSIGARRALGSGRAKAALACLGLPAMVVAEPLASRLSPHFFFQNEFQHSSTAALDSARIPQQRPEPDESLRHPCGRGTSTKPKAVSILPGPAWPCLALPGPASMSYLRPQILPYVRYVPSMPSTSFRGVRFLSPSSLAVVRVHPLNPFWIQPLVSVLSITVQELLPILVRLFSTFFLALSLRSGESESHSAQQRCAKTVGWTAETERVCRRTLLLPKSFPLSSAWSILCALLFRSRR